VFTSVCTNDGNPPYMMHALTQLTYEGIQSGKTVLLTHASPSPLSIKDTDRALRFANRVKVNMCDGARRGVVVTVVAIVALATHSSLSSSSPLLSSSSMLSLLLFVVIVVVAAAVVVVIVVVAAAVAARLL
jgi:hypothetical protein